MFATRRRGALTEVDTKVCVDVYFPNIDEDFVCVKTTTHAQDENNLFSMKFRHYCRKNSVVKDKAKTTVV